MAKMQLVLDNLGDLDGGNVRAMIDREIARAVADLDDRGQEDGKPRKVSIEIQLTNEGNLITVKVIAQAKLPPLLSGTTAADISLIGPKKTPALGFQNMNPERPDQPTFPEMDQE